MPFETDNEYLFAWLANYTAQITADVEKRPSYTTLLQYQNMLAALNAYYDQGIFTAEYAAGEAFTQTAAYLNNVGFAALATLVNTGEGEGDWDSWPLTYHAP